MGGRVKQGVYIYKCITHIAYIWSSGTESFGFSNLSQPLFLLPACPSQKQGPPSSAAR